MRGCSWVCGRCPAKRRQAVSARTGSRRPRERRLRSRSVSLLEPPGFQLYILLRQLPARVLSGSSKPQAAEGARMEKATETWVTAPDRLVSSTRRDACVVHIYPTGPGMGTRYALSDVPMVLGRGNDCDIRINDHSVSRRHARIQPGADGYYAVDLQSTNGTFVNDVPASICKLKDGDYLRVGNCIYRFLAGGNVEAEYHEEIYRLTIIDALTDIH